MHRQPQVLILFGLYVALLGCDESNDQTEEQFIFTDAEVVATADAASEPEQSESCVFGTDCAEGLACVQERGAVNGQCQPFPEACPATPTCECTLALCSTLAGSSCSLGSMDDPASSITVTCAPSADPQMQDAEVPSDDAELDEEPEQLPVDLPFVVDDHFAPTYKVGDALNGVITASGCPDEREGVVGQCHKFYWRYHQTDIGGYSWVRPGGTQDEVEPLVVVPNARRVTFSAWGERRPYVLFNVILVDEAGEQEVVSGELIRLTGTPTDYTIDLTNKAYTSVLSGFGWVASAEQQSTSINAMMIYMDNIRWE